MFRISYSSLLNLVSGILPIILIYKENTAFQKLDLFLSSG